MAKRKTRILAIHPGTRHTGIALMEGDNLIYYGVKSIKNRRSPHDILDEGRKTVLRLIKDFSPSILVIEKTFFVNNKNAALLNVFAEEIVAIGRRKRLRVVSFAPSTVKKQICGNGRATKEDVARAIASRYPELKAYLSQDRKWKSQYHANMFDAVALALMPIPRTSRKTFQNKPTK